MTLDVCPSGSPTTITGTVYDPAGSTPLYGVAAYIPTGPLAPLPDGLACATCAALYSGHPIASAVTTASGVFVIGNAPSGTNVPLVVQAGKWRKQYTLPAVVGCHDNPATQKLTLPASHDPANPKVGELPNIAIQTGGADSLECILARMGLSPSEFSAGRDGSGRIHVFPGYNGASVSPGASASVPGEALWDSLADLSRYDLVLLGCEGRETTDVASPNMSLRDSSRQNLLDYVNLGGRVFASHYHYAWLNIGPFASATTPPMATWLTGANSIDDNKTFPAVNVTTLSNGNPFPEGSAMFTWLGNVGALQGGKLPIYDTRYNVNMLNSPPGQAWLTLDTSSPVPNTVQYFSVDGPLAGSANTCAGGRLVYSDLHATGGLGGGLGAGFAAAPDYPNVSSGTGGGAVPAGCAMRALTPQELALEFMIFNLTSCLVPPGSTAQPPPLQ